ncbi:MAG: DUF5683 domain-containing protein [Bacteroidota bacterium]
MKFIALHILSLLCLCATAIAQTTDSLTQAPPIFEIQDQQVLMPDSMGALIQDSSLVIQREAKNDYPNPKRAAILGLAIPGAGHIYNKRNWWWKVPFVYGGLVGGVWFIQYNQSRYNITRDVHCVKLILSEVNISENSACQRLILGTNTPDQREVNVDALSDASKRRSDIYANLVANPRYNAQSVRNLRDGFDKNLQLSWIGVIAGHLVLNGAWSFVDAHLNDFDLNEDLSLKVKPSFQNIAMSPTPFVGTSVVLEF